MGNLPTLALGVLAGLAIMAMIGRWLRFVLGLRQSALTGDKPPSQIRVLGIPLLALASPVPWLVFGALPYAAFYFVYLRRSHDAAVFFATIGSVVLLMLAASFAAVSIVRRRQGKGR